MPRSELPSNDPRTISFRAPGGAFKADIKIDSSGMDNLTAAQIKEMQVTVAMFTGALSMAVDREMLQTTGATPSDVLKHVRYRIGQVATSMVDGSIVQDPKETSPSPVTGMKVFAKELAVATIKTQEGIEAARQRLLLYSKSTVAIADTIERLESRPRTRMITKTIKGLTVGMLRLFHRSEGIDEALDLVEGEESTMPQVIQELTDHFGKDATDQEQ